MNEVIDLAICFDARYATGAIVSLAGVAVKADHDTRLRFHLFTDGVD